MTSFKSAACGHEILCLEIFGAKNLENYVPMSAEIIIDPD